MISDDIDVFHDHVEGHVPSYGGPTYKPKNKNHYHEFNTFVLKLYRTMYLSDLTLAPHLTNTSKQKQYDIS